MSSIRKVRDAFCIAVLSAGIGLTPLVSTSAAAGPAVSRGDVALNSAIRKEAGGKIGKFYATRGYRPIWVANGRIGPAAQIFLRQIDDAELDALDPARYGSAKLRKAIAIADRGGAAALADAEVALSKAFVRYIRDVRRPRDVGMIYAEKGLQPPKLADDAVLRVASARDFDRYVSSMGWMSAQYLRMRNILRTAIAANESAEVIDTIRLNIERARVLPSPAVRHIVVDAASARLWYYQNGELAGSMKVVVGTAETQTPMLAGYVNWAIFNPYWNVPDYLVRDNVARKVLAGRTLASMHMEVLSDWTNDAALVDPGTVDWQAVADGQVDLRVRERPGPYNSMGKVKFVFPNDEGIYLHDTPNRDLLAKADRHLSNGCIRLEKADELGKWMMGKSYVKPGKQPESPVALPARVPVYMTYLTVTATKSGIALLDDVYGRDERRAVTHTASR